MAKRKKIKHGIYIEAGLKYKTKKIYNNGHLMATYGRQPKNIDFNCVFINDTNQHYCGGWHMSDFDHSNETLINRVLDGLKPFCCVYVMGTFPSPESSNTEWVWGKEQEEKLAALKKLVANRSDIISKGSMRDNDDRNIYDLCVSLDTTLGELVNLEELEEVYNKNNIPIKCANKKNKHLSEYFDGYDHEDVEIWETGLVLGYPIENTISIYKGVIR